MDIDNLVHPFLKISEDIAFNNTLLIQLGIFLATYFILKPLLWSPMLASLDQRRALTKGQKDQAALEEAEIIRLENEYNERLRAARIAASEERTKTRAAAQESAKGLLDTAKAEAAKAVTVIRGEITAASKKAREDLKNEADATSKAMTAKILGRTV